MLCDDDPPRYLKFWGWVFVLVTAGIALFQPEKNFTDEEERERDRKQAEEAEGINDVEEASPKPAPASAGRRRAKAALAEAPLPRGSNPPPSSAGGGGGWGGPLADIVEAYRLLLGVIRLPAVWGISAFLLRYIRLCRHPSPLSFLPPSFLQLQVSIGIHGVR